MAIHTAGFFILGITRNGQKFRPSDWAERIASAFCQYDARHCVRYSPMIMPASHENVACLFVAADLANCDPSGYHYIMEFARSNLLQIKTNSGELLPETPTTLQHVA